MHDFLNWANDDNFIILADFGERFISMIWMLHTLKPLNNMYVVF